VSEHTLVNLLVVDRALTDIEHIAQTLREAGYVVQLYHAELEKDVYNIIEYKPLDLIMVRLTEGLPTLDKMRTKIKALNQNITLLAIVDEFQQPPPAQLLNDGADNFFLLSDARHLVLTVDKELNNLQMQRQAHSFEARYKEVEGRWRSLLNSSRDAIAYIHEGAHVFTNPAYFNLFGYNGEADLEGVPLMNMVPRDSRDKLKNYLRRSTRAGKSVDPIEIDGLHNNGDKFPMQMECAPTQINEEPCLQILIRQPAAEQTPGQRLEEAAKHDSFTGLYNRRFFTQFLQDRQQRVGDGAVLYILLMDYRAISENLGLEAIDRLALELANLLKQLVSKNDLVARFADPVFTIYTPTADSGTVLKLGEQICEAIKSHATATAHKLVSTNCAIGICLIKKSYDNALQIISHADRACEVARQMGPNHVQIYSPPSDKVSKGGAQEDKLVGLIRDAISGERLHLLYQPIASFQNADERYKVYLRIHGEDNKPLPMDSLAPIAEQRGLMRPLDKWVIVRGIEAMTERYQIGGKPVTLFIRISQNSVTEDTFCEWLGKHLKDAGFAGDVLVFEVTESCAERHYNEATKLRNQLRELKCGFALSHFGTQTSSARILEKFAPDYIKLDGSLIAKLTGTKDRNQQQNLSALIEQAQALQTQVIATHVATAPQIASIWQSGLSLAQGDMVQEPSPDMNFDFQQFAG